ncbi:cell division protein, partial [Burkholderia multivorans]
MTPTEEFRTAMRGYEKSEVDSRLQQLRTEIESVRKALSDARSQVINADRAKLQIAGELSEAKAQLKKAANENAEAAGPPGSRIDHL